MGNAEKVTAVVSGVLPSEQRLLAAMPNVEVVVVPGDANPALRRLRNFGEILSGWPDDTPVAHRDAGDILFQSRVTPLWDIVRRTPTGCSQSRKSPPTAMTRATDCGWSRSPTRVPRTSALNLLLDLPVLNAGFFAGTARAMRLYLTEARGLLNSPALHGSTDWGDQTAMNLFCRSNPDRWLELPRGWNFCLSGLDRAAYRIDPDGRTERTDGEPLYVVHGAGGRLRRWDLVHLTA